jgi:hypothetical protein
VKIKNDTERKKFCLRQFKKNIGAIEASVPELDYRAMVLDTGDFRV